MPGPAAFTGRSLMLGEPERARCCAVDTFSVGRMAERYREVLEQAASRGWPTAGR